MGVVAEILVLVVVVAFGRHDANDRQGLCRIAFTQHGASDLIALNELFAQNFTVALGCLLQGLSQVLRVINLEHTNGRAFSGGLHNEGQAQTLQHFGLNGLTQIIALEQHVLGGGYAFRQPHPFGHGFVDANARRHNAGAGVGNAHQFKRTLHRTVFAEAAVQCDETALETFMFEFEQIAFCGVEGMGIDAL